MPSTVVPPTKSNIDFNNLGNQVSQREMRSLFFFSWFSIHVYNCCNSHLLTSPCYCFVFVTITKIHVHPPRWPHLLTTFNPTSQISKWSFLHRVNGMAWGRTSLLVKEMCTKCCFHLILTLCSAVIGKEQSWCFCVPRDFSSKLHCQFSLWEGFFLLFVTFLQALLQTKTDQVINYISFNSSPNLSWLLFSRPSIV